MKLFRILVALTAVVGVSTAFWASLDQPLDASDWKGLLKGVSYSPSGLYSEAQKDEPIPEEVLRRDFAQLSKVTKRIRTYEVSNGRDRIPAIARDYGLKVSLGMWLSGDQKKNEYEVTTGIRLANEYPDVIDRVFVGNEVVGVRGELTPVELNAYIKRVRGAIKSKKIEVGTAEVWGTFLQHPELAKEADFIGIHLLPYWEGIASEKAMDYVTNNYETIRKKFPGKKIVIGETGWPSEGRMKKGSVPSPALQAQFLRNFLNMAGAKNYDYYVIEAFDQPWKGDEGLEGAVGAFWGIFKAEGETKFSFTGPLTSFQNWRPYAEISAAGIGLIGLVVLGLMPLVSIRGYAVVASIVGLTVIGALMIVDSSSLEYVDWRNILAIGVIMPAGIFTALLLFTETSELALSLWRKKRLPEVKGELGSTPMVSIHVPTHDEPPLMVMQTLNALSRLDYPNFEVILLDNNTKDETLWRPVMHHCETLGPRFRFFHLEGVKGFKAGALNKALELTNPQAEYVAVIDSDYQVSPEWLKSAMPGFADPKVAIVQAPQDYRDSWESIFKKCLYEEYTGFFRIGMVERNEHNAIIQHGTMCVVRRNALEEVGRWAEWCITEDTELGLRLFEAGYTALYSSASMGRGLMPDTYDAYKGQRYRWVYGAMQILKKHAREIFKGESLSGTGKTKLTLAQRYHFVAGWLPWFADGFSLIFAVLALIWTALMVIAPKHFDVPLAALSSVALALFTVKTIKTVWLHGAKVGTGVRGSLASALTGLSLSYTVGKGVLSGILTSGKPFLRTPKCADTASWKHAFRIAKAETLMLIAVILALVGTAYATQLDDPAEMIWAAALGVMSVPFAASVLVALGSTLNFGRRPALQPDLGPVPVMNPPKLDLAA